MVIVDFRCLRRMRILSGFGLMSMLVLVAVSCDCTTSMSVGVQTDGVVLQGCLVDALSKRYGPAYVTDGGFVNAVLDMKAGVGRGVSVASLAGARATSPLKFEDAPMDGPSLRAVFVTLHDFSDAQLAETELEIRSLLLYVASRCGVNAVGRFFCVPGRGNRRMESCYAE